MEKRLRHAGINEEFGVLLGQLRKFRSYDGTILRGQRLRAAFADLRRVQANPYAVHAGLSAPKGYVILEVARTLHHRRGDDPMRIELTAVKVLQNAFVSGGLSAHVVMFGQAVDRAGGTFAP